MEQSKELTDLRQVACAPIRGVFMKWLKSVGWLLVLARFEPAFTGNEQSQPKKSNQTSLYQYGSINTDNSDYDQQDFFDKTSLHEAFSNIANRKIDDNEKRVLMLSIYNKAQHLIEKPDDYVTLLKATASRISQPEAKLSAAIFIRNSVKIFKELKPGIDDIMKLQSQLLEIQVDLEQTVATLIKLKETFINDFKGCDLIRLLAYGCENPCFQYKEQLEALKKLHDIKF